MIWFRFIKMATVVSEQDSLQDLEHLLTSDCHSSDIIQYYLFSKKCLMVISYMMKKTAKGS